MAISGQLLVLQLVFEALWIAGHQILKIAEGKSSRAPPASLYAVPLGLAPLFRMQRPYRYPA